jgi:hypothetical protein
MTLPPDGGDMTEEGVRPLRRALVAGALPFLPEITGGKHTVKPHSTWRERTEPFDPDVSYANAYGPLLNTAMILDGSCAADIDIDDPDDAEDAADILQQTLGASPCIRSRANSPRRALLYRCDDPQGFYHSLKGAHGAIEVFAGRRTKLTAFGWHVSKETGVWTRMQWHNVPGNVPRDELPLITHDQVQAALNAVRDVLGDAVSHYHHIPGQHSTHKASTADPSEVFDAASCVPNTGPCDWQTWNRWGMALYGATAGHDYGLAAFVEWTNKNPSSAHRDCFTRWQDYGSSPPSSIGAGTVFREAIANGYRKPSAKAAADTLAWREQEKQKRRAANHKATI